MTEGREDRDRIIYHPTATYVIIDLEWNQPIPWIKSRVDPKQLPGEIIEIGAVKLSVDERGTELSKPFHVLIRPICYTVMNKNVSRVINKISSDLRHGLTFIDAYEAFIRWCGDDFVICGWGNSDLSILKANLRFHDRSALLGRHFLDVQTLFSKVAEDKNVQRSVEYAVDFLRIPKLEDFHEAHRDAEYTGKILEKLFDILENDEPAVFRLEQYLFDPDLNVQSERRTDYCDSWADCCTRTFSEPAVCPACGAPLCEELPWFRIRKSGFSLFRCDTHNLIAGRVRLKKNADGRFYASVVLKLIQPGEARPINERHEEYLVYGTSGKPREENILLSADETINPEDSLQ
ncbi:MAG: exonuclease domain-containing protein [Oscillospiraceae bacterium]|nr:exonuclease domain-containing protein [Oscillospiraceae bacterium]